MGERSDSIYCRRVIKCDRTSRLIHGASGPRLSAYADMNFTGGCMDLSDGATEHIVALPNSGG